MRHTPWITATAAASVLALAATAAAPRPQTAAALEYKLQVQPSSVVTASPSGRGAVAGSVTFVFTVTNTAGKPYTGMIPTAQRFDFAVYRADDTEGQPVWKWSNGMAFAQMVMQVILPPGQPWSTAETWKFTMPPIAAGQYRVVATYKASGGTAESDFEIRQ